MSAEFEDVIRRERSRSDRTGRPFTLVIWRQHRMEELRKRARQTDYVGWIDQERRTPAILLVNTGLEQAYDFIVDFDRHTQVSYEVHAYPDSWSEDLTSRRLPVWKRGMDIVVSAFFLTVLSPILALLSLYIKIVSPGPVLYKSERVGYRGRLFTFLKFRTMRHAPAEKATTHVQGHKEHLRELIRNSDAPMPKLDAKGDSRIYFGGGILRRSSMDELPQLLNILRGDMTLIGPRPCIPYEAEMYLRWHHGRFDVVPGLTGLWQVSGKNRLSFKEMIRLDIQYARNIRPLMDLKILLKTFPVVIGMLFESTTSRLSRAVEERRDRRNRRDRRKDVPTAQELKRRKEDERLDKEARVRYHAAADRRARQERRAGMDRRAQERGPASSKAKDNGKTAG